MKGSNPIPGSKMFGQERSTDLVDLQNVNCESENIK